jgi:class 3 adenylate cyclase
MSPPALKMDAGLLLFADISGYTAFLEAVAASHPEMTSPGGEVPPAFPIMTSLLDVVLKRIRPPFLLADLEGDAVFWYAPGDQLKGEAAKLLRVVQSAYGAFRARVDEAMVLHKHDCHACRLFPSLELKFIVHYGHFLVERIAGRTQLVGPAINAAHRLLKNSITETTGDRRYVFMSDAAVNHLGLMPEVGILHEERYADVGSIIGRVISLQVDTVGRPPTHPATIG